MKNRNSAKNTPHGYSEILGGSIADDIDIIPRPPQLSPAFSPRQGTLPPPRSPEYTLDGEAWHLPADNKHKQMFT